MLWGNGTSFADPIQASTPQMTPEPTWLYLTSAHWAAVMPVLSYWMASAFYGFINAFDFFPQHRIHPTAEECKKNLAKRSYVLRHVLIMHLVQLIAGFPLAKFQAPETAADHSSFNLPFSPFKWLGNASGANIVYHNVHHQSWGLKVRIRPIQHTLHCYLSAQNKYGTDKIVLSNRPTSRSTSRGRTSSSTPSTRPSALYVRLRRRPRYARGPSRGD